MVHYEDTIHSPERLRTPLKRVGPKGSGEFEPITWEEAVATIAARFKDSLQKYGGRSIILIPMQELWADSKSRRFSAVCPSGAVRHNRGICSPAKTYGWNMVMGDTFGTRPQEMSHS